MILRDTEKTNPLRGAHCVQHAKPHRCLPADLAVPLFTLSAIDFFVLFLRGRKALFPHILHKKPIVIECFVRKLQLKNSDHCGIHF